MAIEPGGGLRFGDGRFGRTIIAVGARTGEALRWLARLIPRRSAKTLAVLGVTALALGGSVDGVSRIEGRSRAPAAGAFEIRGFSYPSYHNGAYASAESTAALAELAKTGANFVAIIPTRWSRTFKDSEFLATDQTESDAGVLKAIADAHALGLSVLLKPHVDPADGKPRAEYAPTEVDAWFRNYTAFLLHYAAMAAANHVEMFNIGCELDSMVGPHYRNQWLHIIHSVREVYHGPIVYAHGWPGVNEVSFLDAVDYIGVDAYDPLSDAREPTVPELRAGWTTISSNPWVASVSHFHSPMQNYRALWERYHKPVIFTELGYKSVARDASRPGDWKWDGAVDLQAQERAYQAFFEVWSRQTAWVKGAFLWSWAPVVHPERSANGLKDYTPQNKPAAVVITHWYRHMAALEDGASLAQVPPSASR
jgi:hypothetical protein